MLYPNNVSSHDQSTQTQSALIRSALTRSPLTRSLRLAAALLTLALVAPPSGAQNPPPQILTLAEATADDLVPRALVAAVEAPALDLSHQPVAVDYALPGDQPVVSMPQPMRVVSRHRVFEVEAAALRQGVDLPVATVGASLWISPGMAEQLDGSAASVALDPSSLTLTTAEGDVLGASRAFALSGDAAAMEGSGFPVGTVAFQLSSKAGSGTLSLAAPGLPHEATYQVHLVEPPPAVELVLTTERFEHLHGDTVTVRALAQDASGNTLPLDTVEGAVITPDALEQPLDFQRASDGSYTARLSLDALSVSQPGPWQTRVVARGQSQGLEFERLARGAFAVAVPTATFRGDVTVESAELGASLRFGVDVATAGRYAIQGVFLGTNPATGELEPAVRFESAAWLEPGDGSTPASLAGTVDFCDLAHLVEPFAVHDLRLIDQGRLSLVHRRAVGLRLADL